MSEGQNFEILIASDIDYETLIAEVYISGKICVLITASEHGDGFDIILRDKYLTEDSGTNRASFDLFCNAIEAAKSKLQKRDQESIDKLFGLK